MAAAQNSPKRYIVTYVDKDVNADSASQILNIPESRVQNGVSLLESAQLLVEDAVLHFDGLGSTSVVLSESEVRELQKDERVMAVEEDLEVHILGGEAESNGYAVDAQPNYFDTEAASVTKQQPATPAHDYQAGYQQALADLYDRLGNQVQELAQAQGDASSLLPTAPPLIRLPVPFPTPIPIRLQPTPWNISLIKAPQAWPRTQGQRIKVAVLDTGIAAHSDLIISGGASFVPGLTSYNDDHGHGTHCAGIIGARNNFIGVLGVAPQCSLYAVKVLNSTGSGQISWILAGMAWAKDNGMKVVSMSLGSETGPRADYTAAVQQLLAAGCVVVAAAGNSYQKAFKYVNAPANSPGVIAVGAVDQGKAIASFSSRGGTGNQVAIAAPGVSINSTYLANGYKTMSGTSMACPHVAGAVALVRFRNPMWTPTQITTRLRSSATDLGAPGNDPTYGAGLLNCDGATL